MTGHRRADAARLAHGTTPHASGDTYVDQVPSSQRFHVGRAFAASALLLAALGIYGVVAFSVSQRQQEFGVRAALGAMPREILAAAVRPGLTYAAAGAGVGLVVAFIATQLMAAMLFGVEATDPVTFLAVPIVLLLVAGIACLVPGRRATKVPAIRALRGEG